MKKILSNKQGISDADLEAFRNTYDPLWSDGLRVVPATAENRAVFDFALNNLFSDNAKVSSLSWGIVNLSNLPSEFEDKFYTNKNVYNFAKNNVYKFRDYFLKLADRKDGSDRMLADKELMDKLENLKSEEANENGASLSINYYWRKLVPVLAKNPTFAQALVNNAEFMKMWEEGGSDGVYDTKKIQQLLATLAKSLDYKDVKKLLLKKYILPMFEGIKQLPITWSLRLSNHPGITALRALGDLSQEPVPFLTDLKSEGIGIPTVTVVSLLDPKVKKTGLLYTDFTERLYTDINEKEDKSWKHLVDDTLRSMKTFLLNISQSPECNFLLLSGIFKVSRDRSKPNTDLTHIQYLRNAAVHSPLEVAQYLSKNADYIIELLSSGEYLLQVEFTNALLELSNTPKAVKQLLGMDSIKMFLFEALKNNDTTIKIMAAKALENILPNSDKATRQTVLSTVDAMLQDDRASSENGTVNYPNELRDCIERIVSSIARGKNGSKLLAKHPNIYTVFPNLEPKEKPNSKIGKKGSNEAGVEIPLLRLPNTRKYYGTQ